MTDRRFDCSVEMVLDIVIIADSLRDNGGHRVAMEYGRQWAAAGSRVTVAAVQDVDEVRLFRPDPTVALSFLAWPGGRLRHVLPTALTRLVTLARRADVLVASSEEGPGILLGHLAARLTRTPLAVLVQADLDSSIDIWVPRPLRGVTRFVHTRCDAAICVADSIVPGVLANGLPPERVSVVLNGVDVAAVRERAGLAPPAASGTEPARHRAGTDPPTVIGVGRLSVEKDFALLVRAHAQVRSAGVEHRLRILGDGPDRQQLTDLVAELGVTDSVLLPGHVDNPHAAMAEADLFVLPSRSEGTPLVLLEALALGVPIVATRCSSGVEQLLGVGSYGELVPPGSVDALASAVHAHLRDPDALRARAAVGPVRALTFDVSRSARTVHSILAGLTGAADDDSPRSVREGRPTSPGRRLTPSRVAHAVSRRWGDARNEVRVRRQRLYDYAPVPALTVAETSVPAARVPAVDVHNHLGRWLNGGHAWMAPDVGALLAAMDELNVATVVNLDGRWDAELEQNLARYDEAHPGRFLTFCQLDWSLLTDPGFPELLPKALRRAADAGAGGLKVWKDLGLTARDGADRLVQPDDPRLHDVWETAADLDLPVLLHTADPVAFWQPVDRRNERFEELTRHPEWQHGTRDVPAHGELLDSMEGLLSAHRRTTFIGAHLASSAEDLGRVADMLARHPNLHVDLSAREAEIGRQPRAARALLERFPDRVLWGTDSFPFSVQQYRTWFRLLETADEHFAYGPEQVPEQGRWAVYGLDLDDATLRAVYADNARRIVPGLG
jgi:glycosyltransferase involved in cell wall biosynthesis